MESSDSSSIGKYSDGVYSVYSSEKAEAQSRYVTTTTIKALPVVKPSILPTVMLTGLVLLVVFCFVGILVSGLHFGHRVTAGDCLGQSWVMFSSILGLLYTTLHLQAARKNEPVSRTQPPSQHPLHASATVIARLDAVSWAVSLIIVAVAVSKDASAVSCVDLVACVAVVPTITLILCVTEKATRPFDLPYLTTRSSASIITCRVSDFMKDVMPEVSVEDSISRRGSAHSASSAHSSSSQQRAPPRPNSHTQHAAAIAAASSSASPTAVLSGPRPPPVSVKEARPWNFSNYDSRTKKELAASVSAATHASETRHHVGGPRALALSDRAVQTGLLPPPVCLEPAVVTQPQPRREQDARAATAPSEGGPWRKDWSDLAADTGYQSANTTPASTPGMGSYGSSVKASFRNRCLSPVVEEEARRRLSGMVQQASIPAYPPLRLQQQQQQQQAAPNRTRSLTTPPSSSSSAYTYTSASSPQRSSSSGYYTYGSGSGSIPRPPPPAAVPPNRDAAPARVRLARAQEALKVRGARDTVVMLKRPPRFTGDGRPSPEQRAAVVAAPPVRPEYLRMPGSFEDYE
ncbi:unnamed protein product [Discula destructiva]